ncbi:MAG: hypothetical protein Q4B63_08435 [Clostridium perfringens]|nr:hypothetical protein [Clostridium perfringens]
MINIKKEILLDSSFLNKNNEIELNLSRLYTNENKSFNLKTTSNYLKIKTNDTILANICIKNTLDTPLENIKLKICNDNLFNIIPSSLRNTSTKESYISKNLDCNIFSIGSLNPNESLDIKFNMILNLKYFNSPFNRSLKSLNLINHELNDMQIKLDQPTLKITTKPKEDKIEIKNIGSTPLKNIVYRYEIPKGFLIDTNSIKYDLKDILCTISFKIINNNILFKIDNIPNDKKIVISLKHININSLLSPVFMTIK